MKSLAKALVSLCIILALAELATRLSRVTDTPLYNADNKQGYIVKPNQEGAFLWRNTWAFNELSMGTEQPYKPSARRDILLIGDSIVLGGNPLRENERLGPALSQELPGTTVWPISSGSWALQNELNYLLSHPKVTKTIDDYVFVLNDGDFGRPSSWESELTHPRRYPSLRLWYAIQRYLLKPHSQREPSLVVPQRDIRRDFSRFLSISRGRIFVVLYPTMREAASHDLCSFRPAWLTDSDRLQVYCLTTDSGWNTTLYRDDMHPGAEGNRVLAKFIAGILRRRDNDASK